jgi:hypothetical protein
MSPILTTGVDDDDYSFKFEQFSGKISDLEGELLEVKNKYEVEAGKVTKLNKTVADLKCINRELEE